MSLLKNTSKVSFFTMMSRVLGLVRDGVFARVFGAGAAFDVFLIAFKIPQFVRRIFAEGAFSQAFIPVLKEQESAPQEEMALYLNQVFTFLIFSSGLVTLSAWFFPDIWIVFFAAGLRHDLVRYAQALEMVRWIFPCVMLIAVGSFFGAALQARHYFSAAAMVPALQNVVFIVFALQSGYFSRPIDALVWGLMCASALQVAWLWWQYRRLYAPLRMGLGWGKALMKTLLLMGRGMFATSTNQISVVVDSILLSFLPAGSMSLFYYAERLSNLPLGLFGVSICTVLSPSLAKAHQASDHEAFFKQLDWAVLVANLLCIPSAVGLFLCAEPIIAMLFLGGKFGVHEVHRCAMVLRVLACGIPAFTLSKVFVCAYAAKREMRWPTRSAVLALCVNVVLSTSLIAPFGYLAVGIAMTVSSYVNVLVLWWHLYGVEVRSHLHDQLNVLGRIGLACVSLLSLQWILPEPKVWQSLGALMQMGTLSLGAGVAMLGYAGMLWYLNVPVAKIRR